MERLAIYLVLVFGLLGAKSGRIEASFDSVSFLSLASAAKCTCVFELSSSGSNGRVVEGHCKVVVNGLCPVGSISLRKNLKARYLQDSGPPFWKIGDRSTSLVALEANMQGGWRLARGFRAARLPIIIGDPPSEIVRALRIALEWQHLRVEQKRCTPEAEKTYNDKAKQLIVDTKSDTVWWLVRDMVNIRYIGDAAAAAILDRAGTSMNAVGTLDVCGSPVACDVQSWSILNTAMIAVSPRLENHSVGKRARVVLLKYLEDAVHGIGANLGNREAVDRERRLIARIVKILGPEISTQASGTIESSTAITSGTLTQLRAKLGQMGQPKPQPQGTD